MSPSLEHLYLGCCRPDGNQKEYDSQIRSSYMLNTALVEEYKSGYPRFASILSSYEPFFICRRFNRLRARLLLLKQDKLSILEQRLDQVDEQETSLLFLGKSRCDQNAERSSILLDIEASLADYGISRN
jgi:hypothetical protein